MPSARDQKIIDLYVTEQWQVSAIAAHVGLTTATIYGILRAGAVKLRDSQRDQRRARQVAELYRQGLTIRQISRQLSLNPRTVSRDLEDAGEPVRTPAQRRQRILELFADGTSIPEIAAMVDAIPETVVRALRAGGITDADLRDRHTAHLRQRCADAVRRYAHESQGKLTAVGYDRWRTQHAPKLPSVRTLTQHLGPWPQVLAAADVTGHDPRRELVIKTLQRLGDGVTSGQYRQAARRDKRLPNYQAAIGLFGGWTEACQAAGVQHVPFTQGRRRRCTWPQFERALAELCRSVGSCAIKDYERLRATDTHLPSVASIYRRYGTWKNACQEAGVPYRHGGRSDTDQARTPENPAPVPGPLRDLLHQLAGEQPDGRVHVNTYIHARQGNEQTLPSVSAIYSTWGSFRALLALAELDETALTDVRPRIADQTLLANLRAAIKLAGTQKLSCTHYDQLRAQHTDAQLVSSSVIRKHLGHWPDAVAQAAIAA